MNSQNARFLQGALIGLILGVAGAAAAETLGEYRVQMGRDLLNICSKGSPGSPSQEALAFCYGYISGAGNFYRTVVQSKAIPPLACPPKGLQITLEEIRTMYVSWAQAHPDKLNGSSTDALVESAADRWPCR